MVNKLMSPKSYPRLRPLIRRLLLTVCFALVTLQQSGCGYGRDDSGYTLVTISGLEAREPLDAGRYAFHSLLNLPASSLGLNVLSPNGANNQGFTDAEVMVYFLGNRDSGPTFTSVDSSYYFKGDALGQTTTLSIPNGTYGVHAFGYLDPSMQGPIKCGHYSQYPQTYPTPSQESPLTLDGIDKNITIVMDSKSCPSPNPSPSPSPSPGSDPGGFNTLDLSISLCISPAYLRDPTNGVSTSPNSSYICSSPFSNPNSKAAVVVSVLPFKSTTARLDQSMLTSPSGITACYDFTYITGSGSANPSGVVYGALPRSTTIPLPFPFLHPTALGQGGASRGDQEMGIVTRFEAYFSKSCADIDSTTSSAPDMTFVFNSFVKNAIQQEITPANTSIPEYAYLFSHSTDYTGTGASAAALYVDYLAAMNQTTGIGGTARLFIFHD